ncbi:MAG: Zn-ribbon domain-containing OB-fold protein [Rhizobiaceae bacterium]
METDLKAILPRPTAATRPFWEACNREELLLAHCEECGNDFYYPRLACPNCGSSRIGWRKSAGRGRVFSFSHVQMSFHGPAWETQLPYTVILVELDEGPRMLSRLVDDSRADVRSGDPVEVVFPEIDGQKLPYFRLSGSAA